MCLRAGVCPGTELIRLQGSCWEGGACDNMGVGVNVNVSVDLGVGVGVGVGVDVGVGVNVGGWVAGCIYRGPGPCWLLCLL